MCHGKDGDGKGETAAEMKLNGHAPGPFYIIKNGHQDMPPEASASKPKRTGIW
jgi:hypothetical protein